MRLVRPVLHLLIMLLHIPRLVLLRRRLLVQDLGLRAFARLIILLGRSFI